LGAFGRYHRNEAKFQTAADAKLQVKSGEIWGRRPKDGLGPTVQAYTEAGHKQARHIAFTTDIEPGSESPFEAWWYLGLTPGVEKREKDGEEFACIKVDILANLQV
jgi:hypothetical protein